MTKHLLDTADLSRDRTIALLDLAKRMARVNEQDIKKLPSLRGKTVVNLFYEDSTRTRISFEIAAKRLSADVVNFSAKGSSVSKGESLKDTAQTLEALGAEIVVIRHPASGAAQLLANSGWLDASIVNAGDGSHQHPTQALLDAYTLRERLFQVEHSRVAVEADIFGAGLDERRILIVGDILHSRVARSNLNLLTTLGAQVHLAGPETLLPSGISAAGVHRNLDEAIAEVRPDAIMMLRIQAERMASAFFPSEKEYARFFGLSAQRLSQLPAECLVMHPGPMNRGLEISSEAADSPRSTVLDQVRNGLSVRMAVLFDLMNPEEAP